MSVDPEALQRTREMWQKAAEGGYEHTMDVFAEAMMDFRNCAPGLLRLTALEQAARDLVKRLDEMEDPLNSICTIAYDHGVHYDGPSWGEPLAKLRALVEGEKP